VCPEFQVAKFHPDYVCLTCRNLCYEGELNGRNDASAFLQRPFALSLEGGGPGGEENQERISSDFMLVSLVVKQLL
jgi:hypothetical protein